MEGQDNKKRARTPTVNTKLTRDKQLFVCPYTGVKFDKGPLCVVGPNGRLAAFSSMPAYRRWLEEALGTDHKNFASFLAQTCERYSQLPENVPASLSNKLLATCGGEQTFDEWFAPFELWLELNEQQGTTPAQWLEQFAEKKADKPKQKKAKPEPLRFEPSVLLTTGGKKYSAALTVEDVVKFERKLAKFSRDNPEAQRLSVTQDKFRVEFFSGEDRNGLVTQLIGQGTAGPARVVFMSKYTLQQ